MKHALSIFCLVLVTGCTSVATPNPQSTRQELLVAQYTYAGIVQTMTDLANAGLMTGEQGQAVEEVRLVARTSLDSASIALATGNAPDAATYLRAAQAALNALAAQLTAIKESEEANG